MTINKYQGKTKEEAVEKAKQELGAGAVVLNVKEIKPKGMFKMFKNTLYEVTAAVEEKEENARQLFRMEEIYHLGKFDQYADGQRMLRAEKRLYKKLDEEKGKQERSGTRFTAMPDAWRC